MCLLYKIFNTSRNSLFIICHTFNFIVCSLEDIATHHLSWQVVPRRMHSVKQCLFCCKIIGGMFLKALKKYEIKRQTSLKKGAFFSTQKEISYPRFSSSLFYAFFFGLQQPVIIIMQHLLWFGGLVYSNESVPHNHQ